MYNLGNQTNGIRIKKIASRKYIVIVLIFFCCCILHICRKVEIKVGWKECTLTYACKRKVVHENCTMWKSVIKAAEQRERERLRESKHTLKIYNLCSFFSFTLFWNDVHMTKHDANPMSLEERLEKAGWWWWRWWWSRGSSLFSF